MENLTACTELKKIIQYYVDRLAPLQEVVETEDAFLTTPDNTQIDPTDGQPAVVSNASAPAKVVLVCEHAVNFIPPEFNGLGLSDAARQSHVAWDPGAMAVAQRLSQRLNAPLVSSGISRLVYDCNRPPDAPDAMPAKSETQDIPGNRDLSTQARDQRIQRFYAPFRQTLADTIAAAGRPALVTIHSFTPVYMGRNRATDIGVLHDSDTRLADALLELAPARTDLLVERNQPYGPQDGVTHTLKVHALETGLLNVMLEVRNDLIARPDQQAAMADMLAGWLAAGLARFEIATGKDALCHE